MDGGGWVVIGAAIGTLGSMGTTWLAETLKRRSPHPKYDKAVQNLLRAMLTDGPSWRRLSTLAAVTGLSHQDAKEYLIEMEARGSETDSDLWGLISRNPLSKIDTSK